MTPGPDLSGLLVLGKDLKPVPAEDLANALHSLRQLMQSYDRVGPAGQIPASTSTTSSSCERESFATTTVYSLATNFIGGEVFFPKQIHLNIRVFMDDIATRPTRRHPPGKKSKRAHVRHDLLPYWASLLPIFAKSVLEQAMRCRDPLAPFAAHEARTYGYECWGRFDFPENVKINTTFPSSMSSGFSSLYVDGSQWRRIDHPPASTLPQALCLTSSGPSLITIRPLHLEIPLDMDPIERMALLARYKQPG